jgi:hypothetical protein
MSLLALWQALTPFDGVGVDSCWLIRPFGRENPCGSQESVALAGSQFPPSAGWQVVGQAQGSESDAYQALDWMPHVGAHALNLPFAPFVQRDFQQALMAVSLEQAHRCGRRFALFQQDTLSQLLERLFAGVHPVPTRDRSWRPYSVDGAVGSPARRRWSEAANPPRRHPSARQGRQASSRP